MLIKVLTGTHRGFGPGDVFEGTEGEYKAFSDKLEIVEPEPVVSVPDGNTSGRRRRKRRNNNQPH